MGIRWSDEGRAARWLHVARGALPTRATRSGGVVANVIAVVTEMAPAATPYRAGRPALGRANSSDKGLASRALRRPARRQHPLLSRPSIMRAARNTPDSPVLCEVDRCCVVADTGLAAALLL